MQVHSVVGTQSHSTAGVCSIAGARTPACLKLQPRSTQRGALTLAARLCAHTYMHVHTQVHTQLVAAPCSPIAERPWVPQQQPPWGGGTAGPLAPQPSPASRSPQAPPPPRSRITGWPAWAAAHTTPRPRVPRPPGPPRPALLTPPLPRRKVMLSTPSPPQGGSQILPLIFFF